MKPIYPLKNSNSDQNAARFFDNNFKMNPSELSNSTPSGSGSKTSAMNDVPIGQTLEENGQRRTVIERTKKIIKLEQKDEESSDGSTSTAISYDRSSFKSESKNFAPKHFGLYPENNSNEESEESEPSEELSNQSAHGTPNEESEEEKMK